MAMYFEAVNSMRILRKRLGQRRLPLLGRPSLESSRYDHWLPANWREKRNLVTIGRSINSICVELNQAENKPLVTT